MLISLIYSPIQYSKNNFKSKGIIRKTRQSCLMQKIRRQREKLLRASSKDIRLINFENTIEWVQEYFSKKIIWGKNQEKRAKILYYEMMSSEERGKEPEGQKDYIFVKALPWRSTKVSNFFKLLNEALKNEKSKQSIIRQMKRRRYSQSRTFM